MFGLQYWMVPLVAGVIWLAMLLAMLLTWIVADGSPRYASMEPNQTIAYISDVGAQELKPLFIAMGAASVVTFDLVFIIERWLRHRGRLHPNTSWWQKTWSIIAIIGAIVGAAGLILLSIFDTLRHPKLHDVFLGLFIGGYIVSAIFVCIEYQRLGVYHRKSQLLRGSFYLKLAFIFVEFGLAIAFGILGNNHHRNTAAILEWVIALIYACYVWSFAIDFIPALRTKHHHSKESAIAMAEAGNNSGSSDTGLYPDHYVGVGAGAPGPNVYPNAHSNASATRHYANGAPTNYANSHPNHPGIHGGTYYPDGHPENVKPGNQAYF
ncbi:putative sfk1-like membrane protein [Diplodia seriata]|uniref:Protein sfk1 n=1 Tax=Diplodia seriata TaxID=420778 RepID=A0A0G2FY57_9PEZI|nr:putative sfk1-like membrane protein [Diplodia seriata]OMP84112.1 Protein sfk1 [Diplodia seriata]